MGGVLNCVVKFNRWKNHNRIQIQKDEIPEQNYGISLFPFKIRFVCVCFFFVFQNQCIVHRTIMPRWKSTMNECKISIYAYSLAGLSSHFHPTIMLIHMQFFKRNYSKRAKRILKNFCSEQTKETKQNRNEKSSIHI